MELLAIDGLAACAGATREVASLEHELRDDTVEARAGKAEAVLARRELAEVLRGLGDDVVEELEGDTPGGLFADGDVKLQVPPRGERLVYASVSSPGRPRMARNGKKDTYEDVGHDCEWSDGEKMDGGGGWNERREKECPSILIIHPDRCCVWDLIIDWGRLDQSTDYVSIRVAHPPTQWSSVYLLWQTPMIQRVYRMTPTKRTSSCVLPGGFPIESLSEPKLQLKFH